MAPPAAANPPSATKTARTTPSNPPATTATKNFVTRDFDLVFRAFFPSPQAPAKFNPITAMSTLFRTMLKDEPSLVLRTSTNDNQIVLASASVPKGETEFKKYFKVSTTRIERQNQTQVCIGCHVLSNRSLGNIKFSSPDGNLLAWLKKERIFLESDTLGIERPVTVGYFTKIAASLTHMSNFRDYLANQLLMVELDAALAITLAPHLKQAQLDAMSSGDEFVPDLPEFEIYRTRISHGREPSQVSTEVLGVKTAPKDAKLLNEFLTRFASATNNDPRDGVFIPKGAGYLLGTTTYEQVMRDNNFFLTTVATIPVNLQYEAWFAVIDPNQTSETEPVSLHDHLVRKPWFLRVESVAKNKCLVLTTKSNLPEAREWLDTNLEAMIRKSIPQGIDTPSASLPRRLDKPIPSTTSQTYADILKKQFSLDSTTPPDATNNRPPRKRQAAAILDYDSDSAAEMNANAAPTATTHTATTTFTPVTAIPIDYAAEMSALKQEIAELRSIVTSAVEQITSAIASLPKPNTSTSSAMEVEHETVTHNPRQSVLEIQDCVNDLKHDIATFVLETKAMFQQQANLKLTNRSMKPS